MTQKVAIFSWQTVGATFLDWSLHWLSGADYFYNEYDGFTKLASNPLLNNKHYSKFTNAHNHNKNSPKGNLELLETIKRFNQVPDANLLTCFLHQMPMDVAIKNLNLQYETCNSKIYNLATELLRKDLADCQETCYNNNVNIIVLTTDDTVYLHKKRFENGPHLLTSKKAYNNSNEFIEIEDYLNTFFNVEYTNWKNSQKEINIWDLREFYALNVRPYINSDIGKYIDYQKPTTYIDAKELFLDGKNTLINLINHLGLTLDQTRLAAWLPIYTSWQEDQLRLLKFSWNLDRICKCIIENLYYDISDYNFEFYQEAIIQHIMIYKYGMNFKLWQLEKFPNNTQDLHKLLEPNIHKVDNLYGKLTDENHHKEINDIT